MNQEHKIIEQALNDAYLAGFMESGEGYNADCPYGNFNYGRPEHEPRWIAERENALAKIKESILNNLSL